MVAREDRGWDWSKVRRRWSTMRDSLGSKTPLSAHASHSAAILSAAAPASPPDAAASAAGMLSTPAVVGRISDVLRLAPLPITPSAVTAAVADSWRGGGREGKREGHGTPAVRSVAGKAASVVAAEGGEDWLQSIGRVLGESLELLSARCALHLDASDRSSSPSAACRLQPQPSAARGQPGSNGSSSEGSGRGRGRRAAAAVTGMWSPLLRSAAAVDGGAEKKQSECVSKEPCVPCTPPSSSSSEACSGKQRVMTPSNQQQQQPRSSSPSLTSCHTSAGRSRAAEGRRQPSGSQRKVGEGKGGSKVAKALSVRRATMKERCAVMEGYTAMRAQAVQPPTSQNPDFKSLRLRRGWREPGGGGSSRRAATVTVRSGDRLADIAMTSGLSIRMLQRLNNLNSDNIVAGDTLIVSKAHMPRHVSPELRRGLRRTSRPLFSRLPPPSLSPPLNSSPSSSRGAAVGRKEGRRLGVGGPGGTLSKAVVTAGSAFEGRWRRGPRGFSRSQAGWLRFNSPLTDGFISSPFGWRWGSFHEGVDLAAEIGDPVLASDRGVVAFAGWSGGYGKLVTIAHEGGFTTRYAHCCVINTRVGQRVARGQQVACVGATGHATGPHLHFEVRKNGEALDPFKWCNL